MLGTWSFKNRCRKTLVVAEEFTKEQLEAWLALAMERVLADAYKGKPQEARHHRRTDLKRIDKWCNMLQEMGRL